MQDPPIWFSINAGLVLYLALASLSYLAGRVPKKLYKSEVREFIAREYRRERPAPPRTIQGRTVALDTRGLGRHQRPKVVAAVEEEVGSSTTTEASATLSLEEREAYRHYFRTQAERAQPVPQVPCDAVVIQFASSRRALSPVKHL
jgi:hypothetical protein